MNWRLLCAAAIATALLQASPARAQTPPGTAFTYQGSVRLAGAPLNAAADFQFTLWDAATLGNQIGEMPVNNVAVADGLFTVLIDFGAAAFNGNACWLQVAVRSPAGSGAFTTLSPRQALTATPYARFSTAPWATNGNSIFNVNNGNVGIGTQTPWSRLTIQGGWDSLRLVGDDPPYGSGAQLSFSLDASAYIKQTHPSELTISSTHIILSTQGVVAETFGSTWGIQLHNTLQDVYQAGMMLDGDGFLNITNRINGAAGWARLDSGGNWSVVSDRRQKRDIAPLGGLLDKALALQPVSYYYNQQDMEQTPHRQIGFIAQDIEPLFPSLVLGDEKKTLNYAGLSVVAISAVQELKREKDAEIEALRGENAELAARLTKLEALLTERAGK